MKMQHIEILTEFCEKVIKKTPFDSDECFKQDNELIYFNSSSEIHLLHEICHWIVSDKKHHPNLGFETIDSNEEYSDDLLMDERMARIATEYFSNYFKLDEINRGYAKHFIGNGLVNKNNYGNYLEIHQKKVINNLDYILFEEFLKEKTKKVV